MLEGQLTSSIQAKKNTRKQLAEAQEKLKNSILKGSPKYEQIQEIGDEKG